MCNKELKHKNNGLGVLKVTVKWLGGEIIFNFPDAVFCVCAIHSLKHIATFSVTKEKQQYGHKFTASQQSQSHTVVMMVLLGSVHG